MLVQVVGKRHFESKNGKKYFILNTLFQNPQVEGWAVKERFVSEEIFNSASCGKKYDIQFEESYDGRAFVSALVQVSGNE